MNFTQSANLNKRGSQEPNPNNKSMYPNQLESLIDNYSQNDPKKHMTVGMTGYGANESIVENPI